jgi:endonuclease YncB( thermonuclease family)
MSIVELIIASVLLFCVSAIAGDFSGRVVRVSEGDAIIVLQDGQAVKIRLHGIDAPEKGKPSETEPNNLSPHWYS